jgi:hypothetical protein
LPTLVVGGAHVAALWSGVTGPSATPTGYARVLGELLCE